MTIFAFLTNSNSLRKAKRFKLIGWQAVTLSLLLIFTSNSQSNELLPYSIEYKARIQGTKIKATRSLEKTGEQQYLLTQRSKAMLMSLSESSTFSINNAQQLITHDYHYQRKIFGYNKAYSLEFYNNATKAIYKEKKKQKHLSAESALYSLLSYQTEIRRRFIDAKPETYHEIDLTLPLISKDDVRQYNFSYLGEETINTDLGNIECIKIERHKTRKNKRTHIWLAKNFNFILVRIVHSQEGKEKYRLDINNGVVGNQTISTQ